MGMAVSMLAPMAFCAFDRETDNSRRLAPSRVSLVLDLESPTRTCRKAKRCERNTRRHADQGSAWGLAVSVAKSVGGACDRFHTARMFGPCDCLGRERTTSRPGFVF